MQDVEAGLPPRATFRHAGSTQSFGSSRSMTSGVTASPDASRTASSRLRRRGRSSRRARPQRASASALATPMPERRSRRRRRPCRPSLSPILSALSRRSVPRLTPCRRDSRRASRGRRSSTASRARSRRRRRRPGCPRARRKCRAWRGRRADRLRAGFAAACRRSQLGSLGGMTLPLSDLAVAVAAPQRRDEREALDARARGEPVAHRRQDELRLPVRAVEAQAADRVADLRIGEALARSFRR